LTRLIGYASGLGLIPVLGGNAVSERIGGFLMKHGPSPIAADSAVAADYSHALGLQPDRCDLGDGVRSRYMVKDGRLEGISTHCYGISDVEISIAPGTVADDGGNRHSPGRWI